MARFELLDTNSMTASERAQYEVFPANLTRALLRTNGCTDSFFQMAFALRKMGLDAKQYELVILRVAELSGSAYERMQHVPPARRAGWTDAEIAAIEKGQGEQLQPADAALLAFVEECVKLVRVSDETFARLRQYLPDGAIADTILLVGFYMMTARFLETLEVELDDAACPVLFTHAREEWLEPSGELAAQSA